MSLLLKSIPNASFGLQNKILLSSLSTKNPLNNALCSKLKTYNSLHLATESSLSRNSLNKNDILNNLTPQRFMTTKKSEANQLKEKLFYKRKNAGLSMKEEDMKKSNEYNEDYKQFLSQSKIEREFAANAIARAKAKGFKEYTPGMGLKPGDKIYVNNRNKAVILAIIGQEPVKEGVHICASHIDSPRLDLKQVPLYEDNEIALFKTHYYGGIRKYQWAVIPLALHGVVYRKDGSVIPVKIGEDENDPVFIVTDLLPHLSQEQNKRSLPEGIKGEELNVVVGSLPFRDDDASEKVKLNIVKTLNEKYGIIEEDFLSAELEVVPAFKPKDVGLDRSFVGAYGQDDKVCSFACLRAILDIDHTPQKTAVVCLADKEEIGSEGNTGLRSSFLKYFVHDIAEEFGCKGRHVLSKSECLSADVTVAVDPTFSDVTEKRNACYMNCGVGICKYTGARGKSGSNDAHAEFVGRIRTLMDKHGVVWQTGELGRVDLGGGGTVAAFVADLDVNTIDVGVPILCMHAPFELSSKLDNYNAYRCYNVFMSE
ncbi:aminopeptidase I zinc metalloprotease [Neocallimastix californiae]|jgi:aspartyl aminopeptidase|uniref:Aminopeptidase I zinc metalloprotease n=1 Tax=Neocallimastix californiae TaxID=1754190 RepID=A0A1Y2EY03_9FUNG|nr:aminopeptidase I zinc metalloprotease [Neocallimastix californiae]|eukprot:ORY76473.1 aminopeptidase I zinc metalloprotease [Neocallimastix californiae]